MASGVVLRGDWRKLNSKFNRMARGAETFLDETLSELADEVKEKLHEVVNSSPAPSNTPLTVAKKGFDAPLMETGGMMGDSIVAERTFVNGNRAYVVKGNPNMTHPRSGTSYEDIIAIAENGGGTVPARHVLSITYDQLKPQLEATIIRNANKDLLGE